MRGISRSRIYDTLHFGVVSALMGFTGAGTVYMGYKGVMWYLYRLPIIKEKKKQLAEEKIAIEQYEKEQELMKKQREAETFRT